MLDSNSRRTAFPTGLHACPPKTQLSLRIVQSEQSSQDTVSVAKDRTYFVLPAKTDQTALTCKLILVFGPCTRSLVGNICPVAISGEIICKGLG